MNNMEGLAKLLIGMGLVIVLIGAVVFILSKMGLTGFRFPGDIYIKKENFTFYFPVVTCIIISIILSLILNVFGRR